uniref:Uncharacterized protein n=1 Tax=Strongyloides papillosus TaxID=174720 RepID=A0A0N5C6W5_STREA
MLMKFNIYGIGDSSTKEVGLSICKRIISISLHSKKLHAQIGQKKDFFSRDYKKKVISVCNWGVTFETPCIRVDMNRDDTVVAEFRPVVSEILYDPFRDKRCIYSD